MTELTGIVFDIQRFSIHDGPGIRTTVFLKGCSLRCFWCHNPEGIRSQPEVRIFPSRCIGCGACAEACRHGAAELRDGSLIYHRELCVVCGDCIETCYAEARLLVGRRMTVDEVVREVLADRAFYETSGGGITLSGGEPALQPDFSAAVLQRCRAEGLHTAIETCGNCPWESVAALLPFTDLVMMDLKQMDAAKHRAATGATNERILANARRLAASETALLFRTPVIPGVNDTPEEIGAIARFVRELADVRPNGVGIALELLAFHRLAADKYASLGLPYRARDLQPPTRERMAELVEVARAQGIDVR